MTLYVTGLPDGRMFEFAGLQRTHGASMYFFVLPRDWFGNVRDQTNFRTLCVKL